jgi:large subunit ribosomal protein L41
MQPTAPLFRAIRRLALTTKQAGKDYYKGNRTGAMGWHTKYGGYLINYKKVRTYVCPDLAGFNVRIDAFLRDSGRSEFADTSSS